EEVPTDLGHKYHRVGIISQCASPSGWALCTGAQVQSSKFKAQRGPTLSFELGTLNSIAAPAHPGGRHQSDKLLDARDLEEGVFLDLLADGRGRLQGIVVAGEEGGLRVQLGEALKAEIHLLGVTAG